MLLKHSIVKLSTICFVASALAGRLLVDSLADSVVYRGALAPLSFVDDLPEADYDIPQLVQDVTRQGAKYDDTLANKFYKYKYTELLPNESMVGWISIPKLGIDYPIMFNSNDNNWYLKYNPNGVESKHGSISMDIQTKGKWGQFVLLNGHNMKDDTMFGRLPELLDKDVFDDVIRIDIFDGNHKRVYEIFSVFILNDLEETIPIIYKDIDECKDKIKDYRERSLYNRIVPYNATEALILNTCWYGDSGYQRNTHCIVVAYRVL